MQEKTIKKVKMKTKSRNFSKNTKGITLIALVVTIVVLLILAGVSIVVLFGDNGIIKTAKSSTLQTKFAEIEERANIAYADLNTKKYAEGNPSKVITMAEVKQRLEEEKYHIKQVALGENAITGIELEPKSITIGKGETATIDVIFKGNDEKLAYYAQVEEKYYPISIENGHISIDKTNGKLQQEIEDVTTTAVLDAQINNEVVSVIEKTNSTIKIQAGENTGIAKVTVTYGEKIEPQVCEVSVMILKPEGEANVDNPITTTYGRIDIVWLDENNNIIPEPNAPILGTENNKMKPIKWEGTKEDPTNEINEVPADETNKNYDWYQYKEKDIEESIEGSNLSDNTKSRWANAKTNNGSYFVWIPRYAYRITYYEDETSTTPTGYYDGYGMWSAVNGKKKCNLEDGIEVVGDRTKYIVHPAFGTTKTDSTSKSQNLDLGGWDSPLKGFWFAKFEMSGETAEELKSIPGIKSTRNKTIGSFYEMARTATYEQIGTLDSFDNRKSYMNSHMVKNSEWGAVAYLTHSKYGRNGHEISINLPHDNGTGGGLEVTSYVEANNQKQSTTGNVYGIYDMSGGACEMVSLFNFEDQYDYLTKNGLANSAKITKESNSTKYITKYSNDVSNNSGDRLYILGKTGDASKEVNATNNRLWLLDWGSIAYPNSPFGYRGGSWNSEENGYGIFSSGSHDGMGHVLFGTRTVLCMN